MYTLNNLERTVPEEKALKKSLQVQYGRRRSGHLEQGEKSYPLYLAEYSRIRSPLSAFHVSHLNVHRSNGPLAGSPCTSTVALNYALVYKVVPEPE